MIVFRNTFHGTSRTVSLFIAEQENNHTDSRLQKLVTDSPCRRMVILHSCPSTVGSFCSKSETKASSFFTISPLLSDPPRKAARISFFPSVKSDSHIVWHPCSASDPPPCFYFFHHFAIHTPDFERLLFVKLPVFPQLALINAEVSFLLETFHAT